MWPQQLASAQVALGNGGKYSEANKVAFGLPDDVRSVWSESEPKI